MSEYYNFNNDNNFNMENNMNTVQNGVNFTEPGHTGQNQPPKNKNRKKAFAAKLLAAALAVGMGGGAVSYAAINYINTLNAPSQSATIQDEESNANATALSANTSSDGSVASVAEKAIKSLVSISCTGQMTAQSWFGGQQTYEFSSAGSGVIIDEDENNVYIATNAHVINNSDSIKIQFADGTEADASVVGSDTSDDIAVLSVKASDISDDTRAAISVADVGDSEALVLGEQVVAIGNALGYGQSVTSGYISAFDRSLTLSDGSGNTIESTDLIQTDASINSGDSGGGLFNMNGELVAINEAKSSTTSSGVNVDNMGYAIPISKAMPIIQSMIDGTYTESSSTENSAYLGVTVNEITDEVSMLYNMPDGLYITSVADGSPAQLAGLQTGDIISSIDGTSIKTFDELSSYIAGKNAGDVSTITFYRTSNGVYNEMNVQVTLQANPNA